MSVCVSDDTKALSGLRAAGDKIAAVVGYMYGQGTGGWSEGGHGLVLDSTESEAGLPHGKREGAVSRKDGHLGMVCCLSRETVLCTCAYVHTYIHTDEMEGPWVRTSPSRGGVISCSGPGGVSPVSAAAQFPPIVAEGSVLESEQSRICIFPAVQRREVTRYVRTRGRARSTLAGAEQGRLGFRELACSCTHFRLSCTPESRCWRQRVDRPYGCAARVQSRAANS